MSVKLTDLLTLTRPLAVLDVETTGTNPEQDRVVQIAITLHRPHRDPVPWTALVDPGIPIPVEASAVHGISDNHVRGQHTFKTMAPKLAKALTDVDFGGMNVTFDLRVLRAEMQRAGVAWQYDGAGIVDVYRIEQVLSPRNLSAIYKKLTGEDLTDAHDAGADVAATERVLYEQLRQHAIPRTVPELHAFCWPKAADAVDQQRKFMWRGGEACIAFGKHAGTPLRSVDKGYLRWMLQSDFPADAKRIAEDALSGVYPNKPAADEKM